LTSGTLAFSVPPLSVGVPCEFQGTGSFTMQPGYPFFPQLSLKFPPLESSISVDRNCTFRPTLTVHGGIFTSSATTPATIFIAGTSTLDSGVHDIVVTVANVSIF
jgi:hypothetical protein